MAARIALIAIGGGVTSSSPSPPGNGPPRPWIASSRSSIPLQRRHRGAAFDVDALIAQPAIEDADGGEYFFLVPHDSAGRRTPTRLGDVNPFSSAHGRLLHGMNDARIIEGRRPTPTKSWRSPSTRSWRRPTASVPGTRSRLTGITPEQFEATDDLSSIVPDGPTFDFAVTGVLRRPSDVVPAPGAAADVLHLGTRDLVLTPAFHAAHFRQDVAGASYFDRTGHRVHGAAGRPRDHR